MPSGALAPPEGLEPASDLDSVCFSSELEPPEGVASPPPLLLDSDEPSPVPSAEEDDASDAALVFVALVFVVEVVDAEAFSALVSLGGVMSGVLLGITSELLELPPQAPSATPAASTAVAASAARAFNGIPRARRAGPCGARRLDTR